MSLQLTPAGYQKVLAAHASQGGTSSGSSGAQPDYLGKTLSAGKGLAGAAGMVPGLSNYAAGTNAALSAADAIRQFSQGKTVPGLFSSASAAGSAARATPGLGQVGAGIGAIAGLGGLGYGLATRKGDLSIPEAGGYIQSGLTGASGVAQLAGATGLSGALGGAAPMVGAMAGGVSGLGHLMGSGEGRMYDPAVDKTMGALELAGAVASPFTMGLSNLVAPVVGLIGGQLGMYDPTHYNALRMRQQSVAHNALQKVAGGYQAAAQSGDPNQALTALGQGAGDVKGQARLPVRSALSPDIAKEVGIASGDFTKMNQDDYRKVLDYFAQDPTKLTVEPGKEMGGKGAEFGAIQGSGDVAYLDQQAAQQLQHSTGSAARTLIKAQLLQLYPPGTSPKLDDVRKVLLLQHSTPQQLAALPPEMQQFMKVADPQFDPWSSKDPLEDFKKSVGTRKTRETQQAAAEKERQRQEAERMAQAQERGGDGAGAGDSGGGGAGGAGGDGGGGGDGGY